MTLHHGDVFRANGEPRHLWVVLFDAARQDDSLLLVNFTTLREGCVDDACVLDTADYPFLTHKTTVAYSMARTGTRTQMLGAVGKGLFSPLVPLPSETLRKIVAGAHASDELASAKKRLLPT